MNSAVNELVRSVIARDSLSECSVNELQQLATQYPFFGPAQFLLAQKLKEENSPMYKQQSQRAILYFQDQLWFDYLSDEQDNDTAFSFIQKKQPAVEAREESSNPPEEAGTVPASAPVPAAEPENDRLRPAASESAAGPGATAPEQTPEPAEPVSSPLKNIAALKIEPLPASGSGLVFEPYHAVDYFASQGIRFKDEEKPKDRFGQQLKSFTEWLKTLKKSPETGPAGQAGAPQDDQKVVQLAEHSIADRDVVTEAMADVWEQQGNKPKAIEIYQKLSLLNPAKSSYFAAKIEQLKHL